jgi:hypothetical protein
MSGEDVVKKRERERRGGWNVKGGEASLLFMGEETTRSREAQLNTPAQTNPPANTNKKSNSTSKPIQL